MFFFEAFSGRNGNGFLHGMTVMWIAILVIGILAALVICVDLIDTHRLVVRTYEIGTERLRGNVKICLVSDLHEKESGKDNERLIAAVRKEQPDLVISAGDLLTAGGTMTRDRMQGALHLMRELAAEFPVYAAHGNHEQKLWRDKEQSGGGLMRFFEETLAKDGVVLLRNAVAKEVLPGMDIYGLEVPRQVIRKEAGARYTAEEVCESIGAPDAERFSLLIGHDPAQMAAYTAWGADLVLSGHVHGGIARLPLIGGLVAPPFELFPKYDRGLFTERSGAHTTHMVVSAGLGEHTLPLRFYNPRELVVITLKGNTSGTGSEAAGV